VRKVVETKPDIRLVILGEGDERKALEERIKRLGLEERVLMPGYVENAGRYLHLFHLFVLSSLTEGLPIVILEAMRAGVPIVATKVGGVPDVLENGGAGVLVEPSNVEELYEAIGSVIDCPENARQLAIRARQTAKDKYSSSKMSCEYFKIYEVLMNDGHAKHRVMQGCN